MEPEVEEWLDSLPPVLFAVVASRVDYLADVGASIRMPRSRSLGDGLFELRFDLGRLAQRITFFFPGERRIVLLTVFRKCNYSGPLTGASTTWENNARTVGNSNPRSFF